MHLRNARTLSEIRCPSRDTCENLLVPRLGSSSRKVSRGRSKKEIVLSSLQPHRGLERRVVVERVNCDPGNKSDAHVSARLLPQRNDDVRLPKTRELATESHFRRLCVCTMSSILVGGPHGTDCVQYRHDCPVGRGEAEALRSRNDRFSPLSRQNGRLASIRGHRRVHERGMGAGRIREVRAS